MVVESDDKRTVTIQLEGATKFYKSSGGSAKLKDFQPGDHLSVDATQDNNDYYHATRVTQIKQGTAEERAAASEPVDTSPISGRQEFLTETMTARGCTGRGIRLTRRMPSPLRQKLLQRATIPLQYRRLLTIRDRQR